MKSHNHLKPVGWLLLPLIAFLLGTLHVNNLLKSHLDKETHANFLTFHQQNIAALDNKHNELGYLLRTVTENPILVNAVAEANRSDLQQRMLSGIQYSDSELKIKNATDKPSIQETFQSIIEHLPAPTTDIFSLKLFNNSRQLLAVGDTETLWQKTAKRESTQYKTKQYLFGSKNQKIGNLTASYTMAALKSSINPQANGNNTFSSYQAHRSRSGGWLINPLGTSLKNQPATDLGKGLFTQILNVVSPSADYEHKEIDLARYFKDNQRLSDLTVIASKFQDTETIILSLRKTTPALPIHSTVKTIFSATLLACIMSLGLCLFFLIIKPHLRIAKLYTNLNNLAARNYQLDAPDAAGDQLGSASRRLHDLSIDLKDGVSVRVAVNESLKSKQYNDVLTGFRNQTFVNNWAQVQVEERLPEPDFLLYFIVQRYDSIKAEHGNEIAKQLLREVAMRLATDLDDEFVFCRLQGAEFMIMASETSTTKRKVITRQLTDVFTTSFETSKGELRLGLDLSFSPIQKGQVFHATAAQLAKDCQQKSLATKKKDKTESNAAKIIISAVSENRIDVAYQPVVSLSEGDIPLMVGLESFARIRDQEEKTIPIGSYLPDIENTVIGIELDKWMITQTTRMLGQWKKSEQLPADFFMSINLTPASLRSASALQHMRNQLARNGLQPTSFALEISGFHEDSDTGYLSQYKELGVQLILDDITLRKSNIALLDLINPSFAKIDQRRLQNNTSSQPAVTSLTNPADRLRLFCQQMNVEVIAKSVDSVDQITQLSGSNVRLFQGYYFEQPIAGDELMTRWRTRLANVESINTPALKLAS